MKPSLLRLQKVFKLEAERGYDNHAVVGGLERMSDRWEAEARSEGVPEDLVQLIRVRFQDYSRLTEKSRAEALQGLWRRIQRSEVDSELGTEEAPEKQERAGQNEIDRGQQAPAAVETSPAYPSSEPVLQQADLNKAQHINDTAVMAPPFSPAEKPTQSPTREIPTVEPAALLAPVTVLHGVGPRIAQNLNRLGLNTLRDMLYHFPRRYDDYSRLKPINRLEYGEEVTIIGVVKNTYTRQVRSGKAMLFEALVSDGSGTLKVSWFNQTYLAKRLHEGMQIVLSGKIDQYLGRLVMTNPEMEPLEEQQLNTNRIVPVYPLTAQVTQHWLRKQMNQVITYWAPRLQDPLPEQIRRSADLTNLANALLQIHFPDSWEKLDAARARLSFDEIFLLQLGVLRQKRAWQDRPAVVFMTEPAWMEVQINRLPFSLTGAQQRALEDVVHDLASGRPMNRLIQGDVGSGKTVIAGLAVSIVANQGGQTSVMAPTSLLAEQHYHNLLRMLAEQRPDETERPEEPEPSLRKSEIRLLIGATAEAEKSEIREGLADGSIKLVVGTHALIEDPVTFANLQLVVVDEQHRFGVAQRAALRSKGDNPHLMVMTATPIPRSLALTVYGDLDLTVMDEMPPGRLPVSTHVLMPRERERAYTLIHSQIEEGRQAFIIYPLIEESENSEARAAVEEKERLQREIFPSYQIGLLHGRMVAEDKEAAMSAFRRGEYQVLVATTVIEVGVDIPNATVMLVEGANRFGLSQLHQLRGRVGRGAEKSFCLLIPDKPNEIENERLQVMASTTDGFVLAERDLEQRGPGAFLGTRQSGFAELRMANLSDVRLIEKARRQALSIFETDPDLAKPEHRLLASSLQQFWDGSTGDIS
jgi:ATP-dependent DNA helicase RecG